MNLKTFFSLWLGAVAFLCPLAASAKVYICSLGSFVEYDFTRSQFGSVKRFSTNLKDIGLSQAGVLYGLRNENNGNQLYRIDTSSGLATKIGPVMPISQTATAFAVDAYGQAVAASTDFAGFHLINLTNGQVANKPNGGHTAESRSDLAFDRDVLYFSSNEWLRKYVAVRDNQKKILSFRKIGEVPVTIRRNGRWVSFNGINGLAVPQKGVLIGFSGDEIYRINPMTGHVTLNTIVQIPFQAAVGAASTPNYDLPQ